MPSRGAETEYHFLHEAMPRNGWSVSAFYHDGSSEAWHVTETAGSRFLEQRVINPHRHTHPTITAGDELWQDYSLAAQIEPRTEEGRAGVAFRYRNSRCYYFFGFDGSDAIIAVIQDETSFHTPYERVLARKPVSRLVGRRYEVRVEASGREIRASINPAAGHGGNPGATPGSPGADGAARAAHADHGGPGRAVELTATDGTFAHGKIAFVADEATRFYAITVTADEEAVRRSAERRRALDRAIAPRRESLSKMTVSHRIETGGFGVGRNLRFGDLTGNGAPDIVVAQVVHHGPADSYSEVGCITAVDIEGEILWQSGTPNPAHYRLTNDVAIQIHDIDGDGRQEVVYCRDFEIIVADGETGKVKFSRPTPESPRKRRYDRILGDCLFFADFRGLGAPRDLVVKDRYWNFWVYSDTLDLLWQGSCVTGHYPFAADIDRDGHDELLLGYSAYDHDGTLLWSLDNALHEHADGVAIVDLARGAVYGSSWLKPNGAAENAEQDLDLTIVNAASDEGMIFLEPDGRIRAHHRIGHAQNPAIARFRDDIPGLQIVSINFWGNQGILHFFDADGRLYARGEPNNFGSMCLPVNWSGDGVEFFVHSANPTLGGLFDGYGRRVMAFPDDGHPDLCNAVVDIEGDCRDEIVVWDQNEIWIYTQDETAGPGPLYRPTRNPQYNTSNYQASVSLPGWDTEE
jgi:hypothetical protein